MHFPIVNSNAYTVQLLCHSDAWILFYFLAWLFLFLLLLNSDFNTHILVERLWTWRLDSRVFLSFFPSAYIFADCKHLSLSFVDCPQQRTHKAREESRVLSMQQATVTRSVRVLPEREQRERVSTGQEVVHPSARLIKTIVMSHCTSNNPEEAANSHGSGSLVWSSGTVLGYSIFCSRTNLHSFTHTNFSSNIECNCPNRISI